MKGRTVSKRQRQITPEALDRLLIGLSRQVSKINLTFSFKGTRKEQLRTVRALNGLSKDAQRFVVANALADFDHWGTLAGVFLLREDNLRRAAIPKGDF